MDKLFSTNLISWYQLNKRDLPWRNTNDPYKIWLSEIILQQTRVNQGMPYYLNFISNYPTIQALAKAPEDEVMRLWQGLGYYSRARNLHTCAKEVVSNYGGKFPESYLELQKLKGIGKYTAAAIASFAFGKAVPVVDGNVFRVLARQFAINANIADTKNFKIFFDLADTLIPMDQPSDFNQGLMELGATICKPKNPLCNECPIQEKCEAYHSQKIEAYPVKLKKIKIKKRYFYYLLWKQEGDIALRKRGSNDIWQGLFDFDLIEKSSPEEIETILEVVSSNYSNFSITEVSSTFKHILTHQHIFATFIEIELHDKIKLNENLKFYSPNEIEALPKPILVDKYLNESK